MIWPKVKLDELLTLEYGSSLPVGKRNPRGSIPVFGSNGIVGYHSEAIVAGPGIVVGRKGSAGKINWCDEDFWPIDTTYFVRPKESVDLRWSFYLLEHLRLAKLATTTGVPGLNRNDVYRHEVPCVPLLEQRRIVEILDQADTLRKMRRDANALAERILSAVFYQMFGDPVRNDRGWRVHRIAEVASLKRGDFRHRPRTEPRFYGGPYPFIQINDVTASRLIIKRYSQTLNDEGLAISRMFPAGTLALSIAATIAAAGILGFDSCFPDSIVGVQGKRDLTTQEYLLFFFKLIAPRLAAQAPQLAQKNINLEILNNLEIPIPPLQHQLRFSMVVTDWLQLMELQNMSSEKIETLWLALLHRAFKGELTKSKRENSDTNSNA